MITLQPGQNKTNYYTGKKYKAIRITALLSHNTANTGLVSTDFVPNNLIISAKLTRGNAQHQICNSNFDALGAASGYENASWQFFNPALATNTMYKILVPASAGVKEQGIVVVDIPFGGVVDTSKQGQIELAINAATGIFATTIDATISNITADLVETTGCEYGLPQILVQVVQANEVSPVFSAGNGVKSVLFINRDKTAITSAQQVISSVTIEAGNSARVLNYQQLLVSRTNSFNQYGLDDTRQQTFALLTNSSTGLYFGVKVTPTLNTTNVNASKNYFVAFKICPSVISTNIGKTDSTKKMSEMSNYLNSASY
jgi:hypothetical protein